MGRKRASWYRVRSPSALRFGNEILIALSFFLSFFALASDSFPCTLYQSVYCKRERKYQIEIVPPAPVCYFVGVGGAVKILPENLMILLLLLLLLLMLLPTVKVLFILCLILTCG